MLGKQGTGALVTLVERKSRLYLVKRVASKQAGVVRDAIIGCCAYIEQVHTITILTTAAGLPNTQGDRGSAGCRDLLCAPLLSSWERGSERRTAMGC